LRRPEGLCLRSRWQVCRARRGRVCLSISCRHRHRNRRTRVGEKGKGKAYGMLDSATTAKVGGPLINLPCGPLLTVDQLVTVKLSSWGGREPTRRAANIPSRPRTAPAPAPCRRVLYQEERPMLQLRGAMSGWPRKRNSKPIACNERLKKPDNRMDEACMRRWKLTKVPRSMPFKFVVHTLSSWTDHAGVL